MTKQQIQLVQRSFLQLLPHTFEAGNVFYDTLFSRAPSVRHLFSSDIESQAAKLMQMLRLIVDGLYDLEAITEDIEQLGHRHQGYQVKPEHFQYVEGALITMLSTLLGNRFCQDTEEAWRKSLTQIKEIMFSDKIYRDA